MCEINCSGGCESCDPEPEKKVVFYNACRGVFAISYIQSETRYVVFPVNHTSNQVTNGQSATTSPVVKTINKAGEFETLNSIYKPVFKL